MNAHGQLDHTEKALIINALREKARGDRDAAAEAPFSNMPGRVAQALCDQADKADELADGFENCTNEIQLLGVDGYGKGK